MKIAIIGSRRITTLSLGDYIPEGVTEIVSGGAKGVDASAKEYAIKNGIKYTEFLPDYARFGRAAPLKRNLLIIEYADAVIAFWDGVSRGTEHVIKNCEKTGKDIRIIQL